MSERIDELVRKASNGDAAAVDELLTANLPSLRAFVRLRMGPTLRAKESTSDLVQSVCREILENQQRYQFRSDENFRRWLFTTALRVVSKKVKYWQRDKRDAGREAIKPAANTSRTHASFSDCYRSMITPSRDALAKEEVERFERAFEAIPEEHREVISLSRIVGLSHKEIAEQMQRTEASTRQLLHRALAGLSVVLSEKAPVPRVTPDPDPRPKEPRAAPLRRPSTGRGGQAEGS